MSGLQHDPELVAAELDRHSKDHLRLIAETVFATSFYEIGAAAYAYALGRVVERERVLAEVEAWLAAESEGANAWGATDNEWARLRDLTAMLARLRGCACRHRQTAGCDHDDARGGEPT